MEKNRIEMWNGMVYGVKVSEYGREKGYLDYRTLAKMLEDCILNNTIREETFDEWEMVNGNFDSMIYQDYIISERGHDILKQYTDEIVFYNERLDVYLWSVTHFGTGWDYVLTDVKLVEIGRREK